MTQLTAVGNFGMAWAAAVGSGHRKLEREGGWNHPPYEKVTRAVDGKTDTALDGPPPAR